MKRYGLTIVLIFSLLNTSTLSSLHSTRLPAQTYTYYFPIIQKAQLAEITGLELIDEGCYSCFVYVKGFINSLISQPISVIVAVDVTYYPSDMSGTPIPPYNTTVFANVAFPVTLPNQANPFYWNTRIGKGSATIDRVYLYSEEIVAPGSEQYYPLTISSWMTQTHTYTTTITGTATNDNPVPLFSAKVVVAPYPNCWWEQANLQTTTLLPGQQTTFTMTSSSYCLSQPNQDLDIAGQGVGQP